MQPRLTPLPPPGSDFPTPAAEYVEGPGVGLRELAVRWGVGFRTLARWSATEGWYVRRQHDQADRHPSGGKTGPGASRRPWDRAHAFNACLARCLRVAILDRLEGDAEARELANLCALRLIRKAGPLSERDLAATLHLVTDDELEGLSDTLADLFRAGRLRCVGRLTEDGETHELYAAT
ncbi:MAG: hypothetical protein HY814_10000 [Candidatus Riflebacteria bacterium]|nr:hypothetical protein [Candidatus Riflebacteria bacterium]